MKLRYWYGNVSEIAIPIFTEGMIETFWEILKAFRYLNANTNEVLKTEFSFIPLTILASAHNEPPLEG